LMPVAALALFPAAGDQIHIVTGWARVAFSAVSVLIVWTLFQSAPRLPNLLSKSLEHVGIATYGIYLLHPIVIFWLARGVRSTGWNPDIVAPATVIITIGLALLSYRYFELPLIRLGKRLRLRSTETGARKIEVPVSVRRS
jgi:peptidoglycan/LPS O-acetylase OafA/YrhL